MGGKEAARQLVPWRGAISSGEWDLSARGGWQLVVPVGWAGREPHSEGRRDSSTPSASTYWGAPCCRALGWVLSKNNEEVRHSFDDGDLRLKGDVLEETEQVLSVMFMQERAQVKSTRNVNSYCET